MRVSTTFICDKAGKGTKVLLETNGEDEQACFDAISALINDRFGEGE